MFTLNYSNGSVNTKAILKHLVFSGSGDALFSQVIRQQEAEKKARAGGIHVSDEQLQEYADHFRYSLDLNTAASTRLFLKKYGLNLNDFEDFCESQILSRLLRDQLAPDEKVNEFFVNNRAMFDRVRLSVISTRDINLAKEVVMQVEADGADFHALARQHSIDDASKYNGGHIGLVGRSNFSSELAAKIFNRPEGALIGPVETEDLCQIFLIERVFRAEMTPELKERVKDILFEQWSSQFLKEGYTVST